MITPLALRIERFGSFLKPQTFTFPREPGLYLMLGKNEVEPRLAGNGSGKSTVWAALTWLLHGKTPAGLKAGDVCNWDESKGVRVEFDFITEGEYFPFTCTRTWNPNSWTLWREDMGQAVDLAKDPSNEVLAALRLEFEPFLCAVLMAQGEDYFLDMDKNKQAALFGTVMNLDEWERRADRASSAASDQDKWVRQLETELTRTCGQLDTLKNQDAEKDAAAWEEKRKERLSRLDSEHAQLTQRRKACQKVLDEAIAHADVCRAACVAPEAPTALRDEYDLVCANVRKHEDKLLKMDVETNALLEHINKLGKSEKCPLCGQALSTHDWQQELKRAERMAQGMTAEAKNIQHTLSIARKRRDVLEVDIDAREDALRAADRKRIDAENAVNRSRNDLAYVDKQLDAIEDDAEELTEEANPFADALKRQRTELKFLRQHAEWLTHDLADALHQHHIKAMWVRGFKEIRLREIASALSELEMEVNSCVMALGLSDWELGFRVDRETKGGTIQRGFSVTVRAPAAGSKAVPWDAWSGGEKQRLRIAGNAGLGDLVRARTGCDLPLEVWDEPTNGLSPEGKLDLFRYLADRARDEQRVIFLLDHQAHDFGGFAGTCTVIKTPSGSRIRTSW